MAVTRSSVRKQQQGKNAKKKSVFDLYNTIILFVYNLTQFLGWFFLLLKMLNLFFYSWENRVDFLKASHQDTKFILVSLQQLAWIEIMFVLFGILKTPFLNVFMQLASRNVVILFVVQYTESANVLESPAIFLFTLAWVLADLPRFLWLLVKACRNCGPKCSKRLSGIFKLLNYIRYSSFIALYPLGGIGEAWTMYNAYGLNEKRVLELPFAAPIVGIHHKKYEFDVDVVVKFIYFPLFVPGFLFLYFHMLKQRSRKLK